MWRILQNFQKEARKKIWKALEEDLNIKKVKIQAYKKLNLNKFQYFLKKKKICCCFFAKLIY